MKSAAKAFIIIGMVLGAFAIFPIVLGIYALKAIDNAKTRSDLTNWAIVTLIFVSLLGGLFMILINDEDLQGNAQKSGTTVGSEKDETDILNSSSNLNNFSSTDKSSQPIDTLLSLDKSSSIIDISATKMTANPPVATLSYDLITAELYDEL